MATKYSAPLMDAFPELRYEATAKRVRASRAGTPVVDTVAALLVWEPRRITPVFAVPEADLLVALAPAAGGPAVPERSFAWGQHGSAGLDPRTGFRRHTTAGEEFDVLAGGGLPGAAFRPSDPDLAGYVLLDFAAFDWLEDDEGIVGHPRDPFHRVDIRAASRHITVALDGVLLADTVRPQLVYETMLPVRYYILPADVRLEHFEPSPHTTFCPYKGKASYWSFLGSDAGRNIAWMYDNRFPDSTQLHGLVAFFDEKLDVTVDGVPLERAATPWS
ncbi:DUF427 domain-containing protein [Arthrobacter oryzae]|uniref:DUF427 domain-containing protein n=1 Tax=Arthrobacter oryzae TaxID=409290 RepID=A0A3N0C414_9MICC|nr:DUF427 domain-containing protein [Arthrobacter oryzae]RNL57394.1 DUF427 domain-containing protein [Arthrobacter oryzae]